MIQIDPQQLSPQALEGVIDDFILREGTDYGEQELTLERKRTQVRAQLDAGLAFIWYDPQSQTVTLLSRDDSPPG